MWFIVYIYVYIYICSSVVKRLCEYFYLSLYIYINTYIKQPPDPNLLSPFFEAGVPPNVGDLLSLMAAAASVAWTTCLGAWWHQREA